MDWQLPSLTSELLETVGLPIFLNPRTDLNNAWNDLLSTH
mgnify:FL=1